MLSFILASVNVANAQSIIPKSKGAVGITFSGLGSNDAFYFQDIIGGGDYTGKGYYSLGVTYRHPLSNRFDLETGISYSNYKYRFSNASLGPDAPEPYNVTNGVVDIPVTVRFSFLKYLFVNGGLLIGINTKTENHLDDQSGIGSLVGIGAKYDMKNIPVGLFINPYYKIHNLLPFSMGRYNRRTDENGFRLGIIYNLPYN